LVSYFGMVDYTLNKKYILTANFRRDGSSRFSKDQRWSNFGGIGLSWIVSDEDFIKKAGWINDLKVRASYGSTGNQNVGSDFVSRELYTPTSYNGVSGILFSQLLNKDLTWESRVTFNGGFDFSILKNRLSGTIEYYNSLSKNLLNSRDLSRTTGFASQTTNTGNIVNSGIEVSLSGQIVRLRNFNWEISANYTYNRSKVKKLVKDEKENISGFSIQRIGERVNSIYLVKYAGVNPANGNSLYYLPDGKTTTEVYNPEDRVIVGVFDPPHFGGFTNTLNYKGLELSVLFTYMFGHHIFNLDRTNVENPIYWYSGISKVLLTEWQKPGDVTSIPRSSQFLRGNTTRFLEKGDFIRLRNVMLSYNLPQSMINKFSIQSLKLFVQGQNLHVWHNFQGYDPEISSGVLIGAQYPQLRTFSFGLNVGF
jgi:TonB-dependent starch-binding outer membrane protein SusC